MIAASEYLAMYIQNQFIETPSKAIILTGKFSAPCTNFEIFM